MKKKRVQKEVRKNAKKDIIRINFYADIVRVKALTSKDGGEFVEPGSRVIVAYKCPACGEIYRTPSEAVECCGAYVRKYNRKKK